MAVLNYTELNAIYQPIRNKLLFPFKMRDSAARVFVIKQRAHMDKLEKKDLMNDVDNSFKVVFSLEFMIELACEKIVRADSC